MFYKCNFCLNEYDGKPDVICNVILQRGEERAEQEFNSCYNCYSHFIEYNLNEDEKLRIQFG